MFSFLANDVVKKVLFVIGVTSGALTNVLPGHTIGAQVASGVFSVLATFGLVSGGTSGLQPPK